jgi:hypothetical protein
LRVKINQEIESNRKTSKVHKSENFSHPLRSRGDYITVGSDQKETVEEIKIQWKSLWQQRVDDKTRAEGVATNDYIKLFIEKGTVIHATRNFKALNFKEILEQNLVENAERFISPSPQIGGWNKFIKTNITVKKMERRKRAKLHAEPEREKQQPKKGGRGWLHK